jgi:heme exporter protein D
MAEFFHMGGYAFYVWTSFGLATVILGWQFMQPLIHRRQLLAQMARKARREARRNV